MQAPYIESMVCAFLHNTYYELSPPNVVRLFSVRSQKQSEFTLSQTILSSALTHQFVDGKIYFTPEPTKIYAIDLEKKVDSFVF